MANLFGKGSEEWFGRKADCGEWESGKNWAMIVYGDPRTRATVGEAVAALRGLKGRELVIGCGMLEQGLADGGVMTNHKDTNEKGNPNEKGRGCSLNDCWGTNTERAARAWLKTTNDSLNLEIGLAPETPLSIKTPEGF